MKQFLTVCFIFIALICAVRADRGEGYPVLNEEPQINVDRFPFSSTDTWTANGTVIFSIGSQSVASLPLSFLLVYATTEDVPAGTTCTARIIEACYGGTKAGSNDDLTRKSLAFASSTVSSAATVVRSNFEGWLNFTFPTPYAFGVGACSSVSVNHVNFANISCGGYSKLSVRGATYEDKNTANAGTYTYSNGRIQSVNPTNTRSVFYHCYTPDICSPNNNNCTKCRANPKCKYCTGGQCRATGDYCTIDQGCANCPANPNGVATTAGDAGVDTKCCPPGNVLQVGSTKYCCAVPIPCADNWRWTGSQCCPEAQTITGSDGKKSCCKGTITTDGRNRYCCAGVTDPRLTGWGAQGTNKYCCPAKNVLTQGTNKFCCPQDVSAGGWTWTGSSCCLESQMVLGSDGKKACCIGQVTVGTDGRTRYCCPTTVPKPGCTHRGSPGTNTFCCPSQNTLTVGSIKYCCPNDISAGGWLWTGTQCCQASQQTTGSDGTKYCCPGVSTPKWAANGESGVDRKCCPQSKLLDGKYCCKDDVSGGGWTWTGSQCCPSFQTFPGADGKPYCCPFSQISNAPKGTPKFCCPSNIQDPKWTAAGDPGTNINCCPAKNVVRIESVSYCCAGDVSKGGYAWTGTQCCPTNQITMPYTTTDRTKTCCKGVDTPMWTIKGDAGTNVKCCPLKNVLYQDGQRYCCTGDVSKGGYTWTGERCCKTSECVGTQCCPADRISTSPLDPKTRWCCPAGIASPTWVTGGEDKTDLKCCPWKNVVTGRDGKKYCCLEAPKSESTWTGDKCCPKAQTSNDGKYCCPSTVTNPTYISSDIPCCPAKSVLTDASDKKHCCVGQDVSAGGWSWTGDRCCPPSQVFTGEAGSACCDKDNIATSPSGGYKYCCPIAQPQWTQEGDSTVDKRCCPRGNVLEIGTDSYCCAQAVGDGWTWTGDRCCEPGKTSVSPNGGKTCCPTTTVPVWTINEACCPLSSVLRIGDAKYCCPADADLTSTPYGWTGTKCCPKSQIFKGSDGSETVCCPPEKITTGPIEQGQCEPPKACCPDVENPTWIPQGEPTTNPYCCPAKNVYEDPETKKKYCCPKDVSNGGYEWLDSKCCPTGQITSGGGYKTCCPDTVMTPVWTPNGGETGTNQACCPADYVLTDTTSEPNKKYCCLSKVSTGEWKWTGDKCCPASQVTTSEDGKNTMTCCPSTVTTPVWTPNGDSGAVTACCPADFVTRDAAGNKYCCLGTAGSPSYTENAQCCPAKQTLEDKESNKKYCCPADVDVTEGEWKWTGDDCCPKEQVTYGNGKYNCCPATVTSPTWTPTGDAGTYPECCPTAYTSTSPDQTSKYCCRDVATPIWTDGGDQGESVKCCDPKHVLEDKATGKKYCCVREVANMDYTWDGETCCPTERTVTDENGDLTCCDEDLITNNPSGTDKSCCFGVEDPRYVYEGETGTNKKCCPWTHVLNNKYCCKDDVHEGGWSWTGEKCCPPSQTVKTPTGEYECCPSDKITVSTLTGAKSCCLEVEHPQYTKQGEPGTNPSCCPLSHVIGTVCCIDEVQGKDWTWTGTQCCPPERSLTDYDGKPICCPTAQIVTAADGTKSCCPEVTEPKWTPVGETGTVPRCCPNKNVLSDENDNTKKYCCPKEVTPGSYYWIGSDRSGQCCPATQTTTNPTNPMNKKCCIGVSRPVWVPAGEPKTYLECCPADFTITVAVPATATTPATTTQYCCLTNVSTGGYQWTGDSKCCPDAQVVEENGKLKCCPVESVVFGGGKKFCCPGGPATIIDGKCCPMQYANYDSTKCCIDQTPVPPGTIKWNPVGTNYNDDYDDKCCPSVFTQPDTNTQNPKLYCCPGNTTAGSQWPEYGPTEDSESDDEEAAICCPIAKLLVEVKGKRYCCDESWFGPSQPTYEDVRWINGKCCPAKAYVVGFKDGADICCPPKDGFEEFTSTKNEDCCPTANATIISHQVINTCTCIEKYKYCCPFATEGKPYWYAPNVTDPTGKGLCCPPSHLTEDYQLCCLASIADYPGATKWVTVDLKKDTDPLFNTRCCPDTHKSICAPNVPKTSCCDKAYSWSGLTLATDADPNYYWCCPPENVLSYRGQQTYCCKNPVQQVGPTVVTTWDSTNKKCSTD